jgi:hypothetical protein
MTMRLPSLALSLSLLGAALAACDDGTSTGNPTLPDGEGSNETAGRSNCKVVSAQDLALDADTALGFRAGDVLAFVEGSHAEKLTWYPQSIASYGPESGEQALTLTVTRKGAPRLTKYTQDNSRGEIGSDCSDAVEVDVTVGLQSAQGALDEQLPGTLAITGGLAASLHLAPDPNALGGSFHITEVNVAGYKLVQMFLDIQFTKFGTSGQLSPIFEMRSAGAVSASAGDRNPLAAWGPPACGFGLHAVPRSAKVLGFSADDVIARLDATKSAKVAFQGAVPADLTLARFVPSSDYVCALLEPSLFDFGMAPGTLTIRGKLGVKSADGRIDGSWPLELVAKPNANGELEQVSLGFDTMSQTGPVSLSSYGLNGIDVSAYDNASPSLMLSLSATEPLHGELRVTGYKLPNCSTEVMMFPGGGSGTPGCQGATPTEVARASITSTP